MIMLFFDWLLTPQRVAIHRPSATAVAADLHLGYHDARRRCGDAIPCAETKSVLTPLVHAMEKHAVKKLIIAGDLFERAFDPTIWQEFKAHIALCEVQLVGLIPGNHDRRLDYADTELPIL